MRKRSYWWPNNVLPMTKRFGFGWAHVTEENAGMSSPNGLDSKLKPSAAFNKKQNQIIVHVFCPGSGEWFWNTPSRWSKYCMERLGLKLALFDHYLTKFCQVLPSFTQVLPSFTKFCQVWPGFIKFDKFSLAKSSLTLNGGLTWRRARKSQSVCNNHFLLQSSDPPCKFHSWICNFPTRFFAEIAVNIRRKICNDRIIHDDI